MTPLDVKSKLATQKEAAEALGLSVPTIRRLIDSGQLPTVTLGSTRRYVKRADLERFAGEVTG